LHTLKVDDVNEALERTITYLLREGIEEQSRNGPVLVAPEPVSVEFRRPWRRVLFSATRDANPWFHFFEALWMLAGDNDIEFPCFFNSTYGQYSDDGKTMWDAYGHRWRYFFGWDQVEAIVAELKAHPESRRCVLTMWSAALSDDSAFDPDFLVAKNGGKAVPCNTHAYVTLREGVLNLMVCNRSNDLLFGMLGANVVHMSFLQEYLAMRLGASVGAYHQVTNNMHVYTEKFSRSKLEQIAYECDTSKGLPAAGPGLVFGFDQDLRTFMSWARAVMCSTAQEPTALNVPSMRTMFMADVAVPMFLAWVYRKWQDAYSMNVCLEGVTAQDWRRACQEWIERRSK
jgi:thymidylate synthase